MRLLNSRTKQLEQSFHRPPPYAIVSHRWGDESEEVLFTDIGDQARTQSKRSSYQKILDSCALAVQDDLNYIWLDTCCIDRINGTEVLGEAINAMYSWYHQSEVCYAYLHDVSDPSKFIESDWFQRGWTLQELIAPRHLKLFTKDWTLIGTREEFIDCIAERTGIRHEVLRPSRIPPEVSISEKMVWAAHRETTKMEDRAYSMLGILGVSIAPVYGIQDGAFEDLQHKIIAKYADQTLFAWYHAVTEHGDVEMRDADPASEFTHKPAPGPAKGDTNTPIPSAMGLLGSSPSST